MTRAVVRPVNEKYCEGEDLAKEKVESEPSIFGRTYRS